MYATDVKVRYRRFFGRFSDASTDAFWTFGRGGSPQPRRGAPQRACARQPRRRRERGELASVDVVFIARPSAATAGYVGIHRQVRRALRRIQETG